MNARGEWLSVLALASLVSVYLSHRSRFVPSLTAASRACLAFCAIDGVRLLLDVVRPLPRWAAWVDVVLWVALSGPWAWLLSVPRGSLRVSDRGRSISPTVALLAYAALLLALRHPLAAHWTVALQAPRLAVGAWALWVGMRGRMENEGFGVASPEPPSVDPDVTPGVTDLKSSVLSPCSGCSELRPREPTPAHRSAQGHPPPVAIGVDLALFAAASVVGGLWVPGWTGVRVVSVAGWLVAALVGRLAKE